ncbi:complement factor I isoform X1 [Acipenser ruthenus]|uniref:complement factor I isoform X1 n=1 Tax=Acipenser ruthenus TaxID=7906 RepID=UPI0027426D5E|nr:complement factor I isoform X1 [Acipenser ruthenus]
MQLVVFHILYIFLLGYGITQETCPERGLTSTIPPTTNATQTTAKPQLEDTYLQNDECLGKKFTYKSCQKVFCPPWMRCIKGDCVCKLPYQCPKGTGSPACATDARSYRSYCQVKSFECSRGTVKFTHSAADCSNAFYADLDFQTVWVKLAKRTEKHLICGDTWKIPAGNTICREKKYEKGAKEVTSVSYSDISNQYSKECINVRCTGLETTLAECTLYNKKEMNNDTKIAKVTCYTENKECSDDEFQCVNGKCIAHNRTCDGVNDCGDLSDELCCKACRGGFHCRSDVCIPSEAVRDGIEDCLTGEDEQDNSGEKKLPVKDNIHSSTVEDNILSSIVEGEKKLPVKENVLSSIVEETKLTRKNISDLTCGINTFRESDSQGARKKRLLGGKVAQRGQIPWQIAIDDEGEINCGGIYIGGCWVLTAAHCVRPKPQLYRIKIGVWNALKVDKDTDSIAVEKVIIHPDYNPTTYQNDIALIEMKNIYHTKECINPNKYIATACVPWSEYLFKPGDKCIISGWGRAKGYERVYVLNWAHIQIIKNCSTIYGHRYYEGMECAGTYDGSVDTCQGDSGGPLVCTHNEVAYVWGIVSWGEKCGVAHYPGVYTKVAHYYEWISHHVGRASISKYNV